jgi:hypothetical protein
MRPARPLRSETGFKVPEDAFVGCLPADVRRVAIELSFREVAA